jgi:GTP-binding protein HflX
MGRGEENALATNKENFEEFRERVYEAVRHIHITRFPYNKFLYPDYKDAIEKKTKTKKKSSNFLYNINILILLSHH